MNLRSAAVLLSLAIVVSLPNTSAAAQDGFAISEQQVSYLFGQHIAFQAQLAASTEVAAVEIVFREQQGADTIVLPADLQDDGQVLALYDFSSGRLLQAFSTIDYWFRVHGSGASVWESPVFSFDYQDNRFTWSPLQEGPLQVYTHQDDSQFAQAIMDAARKGLEGIYQLLDAPVAGEMRLYVYSSSNDLQSALNLGSLDWIAGHADPANYLALVSIRPGGEQQAEIERQIPHEVAHLMIYAMTGPGYYSLPVWLNEGLASNLELTSSPDLRRSLDQAVADGALIPMADLCDAFPAEASQAALAYAQSESFVRFLFSRYGRLGLNALVNTYASGEGCHRGAQSALGSSLDFLEREWRAVQFNEDPLRLILSEIGIWFALLLLGVAGPLVYVFIVWRRDRAG